MIAGVSQLSALAHQVSGKAGYALPPYFGLLESLTWRQFPLKVLSGKDL